MSHLLDFNADRLARFAFHQQHLSKIWHRHGTQVPEGVTTLEEWLELAHMNYTIEEAPLYAVIDGEYVEVPSHKLIYRDEDSRQLSVMGQGYRPIQHAERWAAMEALVQGGEVAIDTIGTLKDGRRTFIAASIVGDPLEVVPGDMIDRYLICADSYDGGLALTYKSVVVLPVCMNTLNAALRENGAVSKSRHTRNVMSDDNIAAIRKALGIAEADFSTFAKLGKKLANEKMSDELILSFHKKLILGDKEHTAPEDWSPQQRTCVGELQWLMERGPGQELEGRAGTAWGALNSVTAWVSHVKNHKCDATADRTQFVLFGSGDKINARAQSLLVNQFGLAA